MISLMPMYEVYVQEIYGNAAMAYLTESFFLMKNNKILLN